MNVLVAYASKHGATVGIAERIADELQRAGYEAEALPVEIVSGLSGYDAVVLGSSVYYGSWLQDATHFAYSYERELAERPVWFFSSGPLGVSVNEPEPQPRELARLTQAIHPRGHRIFFGALTHDKLSFPEKMVIMAVRGAEGDFRDWPAIQDWAQSIASELARLSPTPGAIPPTPDQPAPHA